MYQRLVASGKRRIVALVACMRKFLILLNSMVKQAKTWDQFLQKTQPEKLPVLT
jgi:transposase